MELLDILIDENTKEYKCYDVLKKLLNENEEFRKIVTEGCISGKIRGFDEDLWNKIKMQNLRKPYTFETVFKEGANIGTCTVTAKQLSYSFPYCYLCGGILPLIKGTRNSEDGSHTWMLYKGEVYDTTLMLIMDEDYTKKIGYIETRRDNPNMDPKYMSAKEFTNSSEFRKKN